MKCGAKTVGLTRWCKSVECQQHKREYYQKRKQIAEEKRIRDQEDEDYDYNDLRKAERLKRSASPIRKCLKCGKDPYPNLFYCSVCIKPVSINVDYREFSINL